MTAAIGLACGLGREITAIISALLALVVLALVPYVSDGLQAMLGQPRKKDQDNNDGDPYR
jgi:putative Mg2+ transporter-C (MgtC) family protein